jgi:ABC-type polysaccharide/polyol phosphate export permease
MHIFRYANLLKHLVARDIKLKYRYSVIGLLWSLLNPVLMIAVYTFAFGYILKSSVPNYALFLLTGMLPWTFFSSSLLAATTSVIDNSAMIKKLRFPLEILPLSTVLFNLFLLLMALAALLPAAFVWFGLKTSFAICGFTLLLALQIAFTAGAGFFLSTATVYFRDVRHFTEVLLMLLFWVTPIVYDLHSLPPGLAKALLYLNPMTSFTLGYQDAILRGRWPSPQVLGIAAGYCAAALLLGRFTFDKFKSRFAEVI